MEKNRATSNDRYENIELPQSILEEFARFLVPEVRKFCQTEEGLRIYAEFEAEQETKQEEV